MVVVLRHVQPDASQFYVGSHIYQEPLIRTFEYVFFASVICLVLGYAVAYYTARFATKYKGLILILLVRPSGSAI